VDAGRRPVFRGPQGAAGTPGVGPFSARPRCCGDAGRRPVFRAPGAAWTPGVGPFFGGPRTLRGRRAPARFSGARGRRASARQGRGELLPQTPSGRYPHQPICGPQVVTGPRGLFGPPPGFAWEVPPGPPGGGRLPAQFPAPLISAPSA
jgi:hypothetical protein